MDLRARRRAVRTFGLAALISVLVSPVVLLSSGEAESRRSTCEREGSRTLRLTEHVRVFTTRRAVYACALVHGRGRRIDDPTPGGAAFDRSNVTVAGRFVAYSLRSQHKNEPSYELRVMDTRTGRLIRFGDALFGGDEPEPSSEADLGVTDIALRSNGSVAWIVQNPFRAPPQFEVNLVSGDVRVADVGEAIAPESLALSGSTLYWTRDGAPRSTTLK